MAHSTSRALETVPEVEGGYDGRSIIEFHLKNVYVTEGMTATFKLKVFGSMPDLTWYKNGEVLPPNPRFKVTVRGRWHRLTIISVQKVDFGIYTFICRNDLGYAISQAMLVVITERPSHLTTKPQKAIYLSWPKSKLQVTTHLKNLKINVGDQIKLKVEINKDARIKPEFIWYFRNRSVTNFNEGSQITGCDHNFSEYGIFNAKVKDSGLYTVLVVCDDMIASSSAEVVVMDPEHLPPCQLENSGFLYHLPDKLEVFQNEEVSLTCKADIDINTSVEWQKNGMCLQADNNIVFESLEGRGVGIKIVKASEEDSGMYSAVVRNDKTGSECTSQCFLIVQPAPKVTRIPIEYDLKIVLTSIGSRVGFYCKFQVPKKYLFYVVWRIGLFEVERSTSQFQVISNQWGMNVLVIKHVDPDMLGEVSCQLRYLLPSRQSVQVAITKGLLVHVPSEAIADESAGEFEIGYEKIYADFNFEKTSILYTAAEHSPNSTTSPDEEDRRQDEAASYPHEVSAERWEIRTNASYFRDLSTAFSDHDTRVSGTLSPITESPSPDENPLPLELYRCAQLQNVVEESLVEIVYSRLESDGFNFLMVQSSRRKKLMVTAATVPNVVGETGAGGTHDQPRFDYIKFQWSKDGELPPGSLYAVDSAQPSGDYYQAGVTSEPRITIKAAHGADALLMIRITVVKTTNDNDINQEVTIELCLPMPKNVKETTVNNMPYEEFGKRFSQSEAIGNGAFGAVYLVKSKAGQLYAAKVVKTYTEKRRESSRREIEIMSGINHHRIVKLHFTFHSRQRCILVMEYLWGGELFERIVEEDNFKERTAVHYIHQICEGLEYLHRQKIVHLDIKPENVVCVSRNSRDIKIVDFGISRKLQETTIRAIYGTRYYIAPEVLNFEAIKPASDMWSLGVVTYIMLSGIIPFFGANWLELAANITKAAYTFDDPVFDTVTIEAKDFINSLLLLNPDERLTAVTARQHPWMVSKPAHDVGIGQTKRWRTNLKTYLETNKARWQPIAYNTPNPRMLLLTLTVCAAKEADEATIMFFFLFKTSTERAGNVVIAANRLLTGAHREETPRLSDS